LLSDELVLAVALAPAAIALDFDFPHKMHHELFALRLACAIASEKQFSRTVAQGRKLSPPV